MGLHGTIGLGRHTIPVSSERSHRGESKTSDMLYALPNDKWWTYTFIPAEGLLYPNLVKEIKEGRKVLCGFRKTYAYVSQ